MSHALVERCRHRAARSLPPRAGCRRQTVFNLKHSDGKIDLRAKGASGHRIGVPIGDLGQFVAFGRSGRSRASRPPRPPLHPNIGCRDFIFGPHRRLPCPNESPADEVGPMAALRDHRRHTSRFDAQSRHLRQSPCRSTQACSGRLVRNPAPSAGGSRR